MIKEIKITPEEINERKVANLPTRPNNPRLYGGKALSPEALKARFDALTELAIERLNSLIDMMNDGKISKEIPVLTVGEGDEAQTLTISELAEKVIDGSLPDIMNVYEGKTLRKLIAEIECVLQSVNGLEDSIEQTQKAAEMATETAEMATELVGKYENIEQETADMAEDILLQQQSILAAQKKLINEGAMVTKDLRFVTPEMFGATGDGKADDSDAIQWALNSGEMVLFEHAEYAVSKPLTITKKNTYIIGKHTLIRYIGAEPCSIISLTAEKCFIKGLQICCNYNAENKENIIGINMNACHRSELNSVSVIFCGYGFYADKTSHLFYTKFIGCSAQNSTHGFTFPHGSGQKNVISFSQCSASTSLDPPPIEGYGFLIGGTAVSMQNCSAEATYRGIEIDPTFCIGCDISGSYFENNVDCDIYIPDAASNVDNINVGAYYTAHSPRTSIVNKARGLHKNIRIFEENIDNPIAEQKRISCVDEANYAISKVTGLSLPATVHVEGAIDDTKYIMAGVIINGKSYQVGNMDNVSYEILSIENGILTFDGVLDKTYNYCYFVTRSNPSYPWLKNGATGKLICTSEPEYSSGAPYGPFCIGENSVGITDDVRKKWGLSVGDYVTFLKKPHYIIGTVAANAERQTISLSKPIDLQNETGIVARAMYGSTGIGTPIIFIYGVSDIVQ